MSESISYEIQIKNIHGKWEHLDNEKKRKDLDRILEIYKNHNSKYGWPKVRVIEIKTIKTTLEEC